MPLRSTCARLSACKEFAMKAPKEPPKAKTSGVWQCLRQPLAKPARYVTVPLLAIAGLTLGCYALWTQVRERVVARPEYQVTERSIVLVNPPAWIHSDIARDVFNQMSI